MTLMPSKALYLHFKQYHNTKYSVFRYIFYKLKIINKMTVSKHKYANEFRKKNSLPGKH